ncbi:MAG: undecaprenyl-phosphate glucose phosphotransferase [Thermostichales cyanobacterium BF3_bins_165]
MFSPSMIMVLQRLYDPCLVMGLLWLLAQIRGVTFSQPYWVLTAILFLLVASTFKHVGLYRSFRVDSWLSEASRILWGWFLTLSILLFGGYLTRSLSYFNFRLLVIWAFLSPLCLLASHLLVRWILRWLRASGMNSRTAVIVGAGKLGVKLALELINSPHLGLRILGFFDDRLGVRAKLPLPQSLLVSQGAVAAVLQTVPESQYGPFPGHESIHGTVDDVAAYVKKHRVNIVYITLPMRAEDRIKKLVNDLGDTTASVYIVPDIFTLNLVRSGIQDMNGIPVLAIREDPFLGMNAVSKRLLDLVLAGLILIVISPIMLAIAIAVKLSSPGPIFFVQRRYGLHGEEIKVYKFRSMTVCEDGDHVPQARRQDQRVTRVGAFLRRTSLDELPQFINVLQGRMSIVGPRPHAVAHNERYRREIQGYMLRHKVKPGITGLAQVRGSRGETETVDKMAERVKYDLEYIANWSLWLDIWIIIQTALIFLKSLIIRDEKVY